MLNLDPGILDQDKIRLSRRKRWLKIALIPSIIFILVCLFFMRTGLYNLILGPSLEGESYGTPKLMTSLQKVGNLLEPYLAHYNSGYFSLMEAESAEDLVSAENDFRESLKYKPPESMLCPIYVNLSYSLELQGDLLVKAESYNDALVLFNKAESILYENNCASKKEEEKGKDDLAESAKERVIEKREKAVASANKLNNTDSGDNDDESTEISDSDLEAVKQLDINSVSGGVEKFRARLSENRYTHYDVPKL